MIIIDDKLISEDILSKEFVCNLSACKGACCEAGDIGAPLDEEEIPVLEKILPAVKPFLPKRNIRAIEKHGVAVEEEPGEWYTPLIEGKECAFAIKESGTWKCAIEKAFLEGKIAYKKPVSCHLYPIRISYNQKTKSYRLNYDRWDICKPACTLGKELKVPVYRFLKEPIVRRFGQPFFDELDAIAKAIESQYKNS